MNKKPVERLTPHATWIVPAAFGGIAGAVGRWLDADSTWDVNTIQAAGRVVFELRFTQTERGMDPRAGQIEVRERPNRPAETEISAYALRLSPLADERDKINERNARYIGLEFSKLRARIGADLEEAEGFSGAPAQAQPGRGRRGYGTKAEKRQAVRDWDAISGDEKPRLEDWLEKQFGITGGVLNVKPRTFQGWRKYLNSP